MSLIKLALITQTEQQYLHVGHHYWYNYENNVCVPKQLLFSSKRKLKIVNKSRSQMMYIMRKNDKN